MASGIGSRHPPFLVFRPKFPGLFWLSALILASSSHDYEYTTHGKRAEGGISQPQATTNFKGKSNSLIGWLDKAQFGQDVDVLTACTYVKDEFVVVVTYASCVLLNYVIMHLNYKLPYEIPLLTNNVLTFVTLPQQLRRLPLDTAGQRRRAPSRGAHMDYMMMGYVWYLQTLKVLA
ncbi:uncharacterized protein IAS62_002110 [Cryptococcus decagattii]|uniref:Uncharacterized protein n=1 Tax=Cryptococcus decagattii TaxID=1859122 RepID=A0ABZ2AQM2_9TREE